MSKILSRKLSAKKLLEVEKFSENNGGKFEVKNSVRKSCRGENACALFTILEET